MTASGAMIGTPAYMSPEALRGDKLDERTDIYSLGVVLYEMVVGKKPYTADSPYGMIFKRHYEPLPAPCSLNPNLPKVVEQLILKALAKEPTDRFQSAQAFYEAIQQTLAEIKAIPQSNLAKSSKDNHLSRSISMIFKRCANKMQALAQLCQPLIIGRSRLFASFELHLS